MVLIFAAPIAVAGTVAGGCFWASKGQLSTATTKSPNRMPLLHMMCPHGFKMVPRVKLRRARPILSPDLRDHQIKLNISLIRNFRFAFRLRINVPQSRLRSQSFLHFSRGQGSGRVRQDLCPDQKPRFSPFRSTFSGTPPSTFFVIQIGFACLPNLPSWQRQSLHPPQHPSKQALREVALRQH